jgi:hypothetical protein
MRRLWLVLLAIASINAALLSGCPVTPLPERTDHGGGNGGNGGNGSGGSAM